MGGLICLTALLGAASAWLLVLRLRDHKRIRKLREEAEAFLSHGGKLMDVALGEDGIDMLQNAICELQEALNRLGYDCGEPDGVCGKNTMKAVQAFADKHTTQKLPESVTVSVQVGNKNYKGEVK